MSVQVSKRAVMVGVVCQLGELAGGGIYAGVIAFLARALSALEHELANSSATASHRR